MPIIFFEAVNYGSLRNMKWLLENNCVVDRTSKAIATEKYGSFQNLLQLLKIDPSTVNTTVPEAHWGVLYDYYVDPEIDYE